MITACTDSSSNADTEDGTADTDTDTSDTMRIPESHRPEALSCEGVITAPEPESDWIDENSECMRHADCTDGMNGRCVRSKYDDDGCLYESLPCWYHCYYDECLSDEDCGDGTVCECDASWGSKCLGVGNCRTDKDCGENGYCSLSTYRMQSFSPDPIGYFCHTPEDDCMNDEECQDGYFCAYDTFVGHWACQEYECCIG